MAPTRTARLPEAGSTVHEGTVTEGLLEKWLVRLDEFGPPPVECALLQTSAFPLELQIGDRVVVLLGASGRGYVVGRLGPAREPATLSRPSIVLEADQEIVLRTRRSSLRLNADGEVEVRGSRILSRAARIQKLIAPLLKLN